MEGSGVKPYKLLFLVGLGFAAWYFFTQFRIQGLENLRVQPRSGQGGNPAPDTPANPTGRTTIRIATANFGPLDALKLGKPHVAGRLALLLRQFDLIALQDIQAPDQGVLVRLVELMNAEGRRYSFATAPNVGRDPTRQYGAFVFDTDSVQIDRNTLALVDDRSALFRHPPLVAAFRAKGPKENEAFTFTLINVQTPSDRAAIELDRLADVYRAVRDGGRNEDDIILLGELGADEAHLGQLARVPNLSCAITGLPTTVRGGQLVDNILFDRRATIEFTHRSGVCDFVRQFELNARDAAEISEHLPVWAEFSIYEGGQTGHAAVNP